jgi:predicted acyl esterase
MRIGSILLVTLMAGLSLAGCLDGAEPQSDDGDDVVRVKGQSAVAPGSYSVQPGQYKFDGSISQPLVEGPYELLAPEEVTLTSDLDGVDIDLTVWRPDTPAGVQVPVVMQASPYYSDSASMAGVGYQVTEFISTHGYAYVQLAIRSTGNSGGCDDFRGPKMTADMSQAIDWLVEQEWSTEAVALIGISYVGTTPWYAAGSGNPHVKTIVPISGSTNAWEVYNRNGTPETRSAIIVPNYGASAAANTAREPEHKVENFACAEVYEGWATGVANGVVGDRINAEWWQERNAKPKVEANYKGSIFVIHGLEDWNVDPAVALPWADKLNKSGLKVKQLLGQWPHSYPDSYCGSTDSSYHTTCRWDYAEILLRWFDSELKGLDVDTGPPVQVQDNQRAWRDELHWPPRDAQWQRLHLTADGALGEEAGSAGTFPLAVPSAVPDAGVPLDALFRLGPLEEDLRLGGLPRVHVTVNPTAPGGTIGAFLYDEDPATGVLTRIGWTAMNLRFADGTETPQTVVPGEPLVAKMEIQPMDAVVPAGHTLVLRLAIDTPSDRTYALPIAPMQVEVGGDVTSVLELPVLERADAVFFQPPFPAADA